MPVSWHPPHSQTSSTSQAPTSPASTSKAPTSHNAPLRAPPPPPLLLLLAACEGAALHKTYSRHACICAHLANALRP